MTKEDLKMLLKGKDLSDTAGDVLRAVIADWDLNNVSLDGKISDAVYDAISTNDDAYDYLQARDIYDTTEAVKNECESITSVARFYLEEEIYD